MLKPCCALLLLLLACLAGPAFAELHLLTEEAPPTSFSRDGELHGLAVDVVRALIERTGDPGTIELLPCTRGYHLAQHEPNTAIFSTVRTPEREAKFQWVGPLLIGTTSFYSLKSRNLRFDNLQQVAESGPLAVPKQWYTFETLSARGFKNLYGVASSKNMVTMLKHERVQLIATEDLTLKDELASGGLRPDQVQAHLPFMRSAYYIAFSPHTDAALVARWRRALDAMHQDGSFALIFRRWLPHAELPTATEELAAPGCVACYPGVWSVVPISLSLPMPTTRPVMLDLAARAQLFSHLAAMEKAGVPVERALLSVQVPARAKAALASLQTQIAGGSDMASAGLRSGLFTQLDSTLLRAAQASGCLAAIYQRLAERYNHRAQQVAAVKSRLLMPAAALVLALFIQPLPALVGGQLSIAGYLRGVLWPLLVLGALYGLGRGLYLRREHAPADAASPLDGLLASVPIVGPALLRRNLRDFFDSLGLMLEAGMPMLEALPKACAVISHAPLRKRFSTVQMAIQRGQGLAQALASVGFPGQGLALGLIRTGEASGTLPASLLNYAGVETQKLDSLTEQLATWLPRLLYAGVMLWMAYGLLTGAGFGPRLPPELQ